MRSHWSRVDLQSNKTGVFTKRGDLGTDAHGENAMWKQRQRSGDTSPCQWAPDLSANHRVLEDSIEQILLQSPQKEQPCQHLGLGLPASGNVRQEIIMFKPLGLGCFVTAALGNEYRHRLYSRESNKSVFLPLSNSSLIHPYIKYWSGTAGAGAVPTEMSQKSCLRGTYSSEEETDIKQNSKCLGDIMFRGQVVTALWWKVEQGNRIEEGAALDEWWGKSKLERWHLSKRLEWKEVRLCGPLGEKECGQRRGKSRGRNLPEAVK